MKWIKINESENYSLWGIDGLNNVGYSLVYKGTYLSGAEFADFVTGGMYYCFPEYRTQTRYDALRKAAYSDKYLFKKAIAKFISLSKKFNVGDADWNKLGMENLTHVFDYTDEYRSKWRTTGDAKETKKHNDFKSRMADMMNGL